MNPPLNPIQSHVDFPSSQGINIDFKRIIYQALRYWYVIILCLAVALVIAYLRNRYATRIYPVSTSIIIKEKEDTSGGRLLYNNSLVSGFRNYLNELYIIRSFPLVGKTIDELNFEVAFYQEGNFLTTEAYKTLPVEAKVLNHFNSGKQFYFEIISSDEFKLHQKVEVNEKTKISSVFHFNDTILFEDLRLVFKSLSKKDIDSFKGKSFLFAYTPIQWLTGSYVGKLNVNWAEEGAGVINLSVSGPNPTKDIDFLNGLVHQYQEYDLLKKNQVASRTIDFITDQLATIADSLHDAERQLELFKNKNVAADLGLEASRIYTQIEELENQKMTFRLRNSYFKYITNYLSEGNGLDLIILPSSLGINDPVLTKLLTDMVEFQTQIKMFSGSDQLDNPRLADKTKLINEIKRNIIESIRSQQNIDKIEVDFLDGRIEMLEVQLRRFPIAERELVSIKRNYSLLENLYVFLLQKKAEAGISRASTTTDIAIVNPPMISGQTISPKTRQNYTLSFALGIGIPILFFVLLELFNTKIQSREDIQKITTIPFIGGIGHKKNEFNLEVLKAPKSAIAESFRALRSNLNYFTGGKNKGVFMITSSISGEGKTFTSINLASVFALSGSKVLIVGADLRKPKIYSDFKLSNSIGLTTYLSGLTEFESIIQKTEYEMLDLVSAGPIPPNPSELLLSPRMADFINIAKERYDFVILDTPPLAIVTDAFSLVQFADHTLFLIRQNYTPKVLLKNVEDFHSSGKLRNISLVLNDIYKSGPGYGYGYGYGGYGYGGYGYSYGKKTKNGYGYYS